MNKRGQQALIGIMIGVMIFITAFIMIDPLKSFIVDARDTDQLACSYTNNSVGVQSTCLLVDMSLFYYIGIMLGIGATIMIGKKLYNSY